VKVSSSHVIFIFVSLNISGLSKRTTSEGLRTAFAQFGEVADGAYLITTL